jgi:hypothetical protein
MQKNKLLLTSALVGAAMLTSASVNAEIKVTGYLEHTHISDSSDLTANTEAGALALKSGTELDLVFTNSGIDLGMGMKGTVMANITNEYTGTAQNTSSTSSPTSKSMGLDAAVLTVDTGKGFNLVLGSGGFGPGDIGEGAVPTILDVAVDTGITGISDGNQWDLSNMYTIGATAGGFGFAYTPNISTLANGGSFGAGTVGTMRSAYELAYKGKPIDGTPLTLSAAIHKAEGYAPGSQGQESITYGAGYSVAGVNVGINFVDADAYAASGATQENTEETNIGVTYTYQGIGLGVTQSKTKSNSAASNKEQTATSYQIGYALGPIGVAIAYTTADNVAYTAGRDGEATTIKLSTKF